jgi:hypothetical protein
MSWNIEVSAPTKEGALLAFDAKVDADRYCPKDGSLERAARATMESAPDGFNHYRLSSFGHVGEAPSNAGNCSVNLAYHFSPDAQG